MVESALTGGQRNRGRQNRAKGVAFERRVVRKFKEAGFGARRLWAEQFAAPCSRDIELYAELRPFTPDHPSVKYILPAAIQLKATQTESDLDRGLSEAMQEPGYKLYVCLHSFQRKLRIRTAEPREGYFHFDSPTWDQLLSRLRTLYPLKSWSQPSAF